MANEPQQQQGRPQLSYTEFSALIVLLLLFTIIGVIALFSIVIGGLDHGEELQAGRVAYGPADFADEIDWQVELPPPDAGEGKSFPVPAPPLSDDTWPCTDCHDPEEGEFDPERRELEDMHEDINLHHGSKDRWCYDCHNPTNRDMLRLANGDLVSFEESYRLCGQCHGTIYRDWREGIHGRRTGYWNGPKLYRLCVACHNPHQPKFRALEPLPPPVRPQFLRGEGRRH